MSRSQDAQPMLDMDEQTFDPVAVLEAPAVADDPLDLAEYVDYAEYNEGESSLLPKVLGIGIPVLLLGGLAAWYLTRDDEKKEEIWEKVKIHPLDVPLVAGTGLILAGLGLLALRVWRRRG